jgi:hypothetical protein
MHGATRFSDVFLNTAKVIIVSHTALTRWRSKCPNSHRKSFGLSTPTTKKARQRAPGLRVPGVWGNGTMALVPLLNALTGRGVPTATRRIEPTRRVVR